MSEDWYDAYVQERRNGDYWRHRAQEADRKVEELKEEMRELQKQLDEARRNA
jgi:predicted RNase H-like nuclease (RuvC/YqgF family)